jgi:hypothetical protein
MRKITISLALLIFVLTTWTTRAKIPYFLPDMYISKMIIRQTNYDTVATVRFYDVNNPSKTLPREFGIGREFLI